MMNGVDISSWQGWIKIAELTTTQFVIVKATGGIGYTNPYFYTHIENAKSAGKLIGAYHYARESRYKGTPQSEAKYFLSVVSKYLNDVILALDWEEEVKLGSDWALAWLDEVYQLTGIKPLIYMSQSVCETYQWGKVAQNGYGLWLAQYANNSRTNYVETPWRKGGIGAFRDVVMHQYSGTGKITGYDGNIDINKFYGDAGDWLSLATGGKVQTETISPDMQWAIDMGIFQGYDDGKMHPHDALTREQAATVMRRMMNRFTEVK